jgi:hypothetical protein
LQYIIEKSFIVSEALSILSLIIANKALEESNKTLFGFHAKIVCRK